MNNGIHFKSVVKRTFFNTLFLALTALIMSPAAYAQSSPATYADTCEKGEATRLGRAVVTEKGGVAAAETEVCPSGNPPERGAIVTGRITDGIGRGIPRTYVALFNVNSNEAFVALSNSFGYYRFENITIGDFYVLSVSHRRHLFINGSISFEVTANVSGLDFVASN